MDYGRILQRAFDITIRYRAIWLFGILAAIFGQVGARVPSGFQYTISGREPEALQRFWFDLLTVDPWVFVLLGAIAFVLFIVGIFVRLLSRAAIIGMVNDVEQTGNTDVSRGFTYGINNFLRLLGIYLVIWVPFVLIFLVLFALALAPLLLLLSGGDAARFFGIAAMVILIVATLALMIVVLIVLSLVQQFIDRNCVLRGRGVFDSIIEGFRMVRRKLGEAALMWLIIFGVGIIIGGLVFAVAAALVAVVAALAIATWQISSTLGIVIAIILGLPVLAVLVFLAALVSIFTSAAWTLAYREITGFGGLN